jgi:hypothetical protein
MILFWLLCVSLLLGGLLLRRHVGGVLSDLWLHWFGARVRVRRTPRAEGPQPRNAHPLASRPPLRVVTRAGP